MRLRHVSYPKECLHKSNHFYYYYYVVLLYQIVEIVRRGLGQGLQGQAYIKIMVVATATNFIKGVPKKSPTSLFDC